MRFPQLVVLLCLAALAAAIETEAATSDASETQQKVTRSKQQHALRRHLSSGDYEYDYDYGSDEYDDYSGDFCCKERATSCEPLSPGIADSYEHTSGDPDGYTVCRSYCAVPCDDDDSSDYDFPFFPGHQCFPSLTTRSDGCDCDCTCCTQMMPFPTPYHGRPGHGGLGRGKGFYRRDRNLHGNFHGKGGGHYRRPGRHHGPPRHPHHGGPGLGGPSPLVCRCECDDCDDSSSRGDDYYYY